MNYNLVKLDDKSREVVNAFEGLSLKEALEGFEELKKDLKETEVIHIESENDWGILKVIKSYHSI